MDVASWLRSLGLERYEAAFRENDVSAKVLNHLTADDLKELGVAAVGHRRQLLVAIAELRDGAPEAVRSTVYHLPSISAGERRQLTVMFCDWFCRKFPGQTCDTHGYDGLYPANE